MAYFRETSEFNFKGENRMKKVGHGKLSLTRYITSGFPQIDVEVDVFMTEDLELKFFYNKTGTSGSHLVIEPKDFRRLESTAKREQNE